MRSQNVAIIILFILILILLYQLYYNRSILRRAVVYSPTSLDKIQEIISNNPDRTISITDSNNADIIINTDSLQNIISLDIENKELQVEPGCKIKDICIYLEQVGLALESIPSDIHQTIGNACFNAEHGSNLDSGTMSDQIVCVNVILSNGHIRRVEFNDPEFPAFATCLGSLGLVYSITLRCVNNYFVYTSLHTGPWASVKENLMEMLDECGLSQLSIDSNTQTATVMIATIDNGNIIPDGDRVPYYTVGLQQNLPLQSEVAVPYEHTIEAVDAVLKLCEKRNCNITLSFTGPDYNSWLSPASGRKSAWIGIAELEPSKFLESCENHLIQQFLGRPSWRSKFIDIYKARILYGMSLDYVRKICNRFDPKRIFRNSHIPNIFD